MKECIIRVFYRIGSTPLARCISSFFAKDVQILMYHRVLPHDEYLGEGAGISTSTELFESHLKLLDHRYSVIPLDKILDQDFLMKCPKPPVVITFDDGYKDNFTVALPLLEKYKMPATFYIATHLLDGKIWMWWYELDEILNSRASLAFNWENRNFQFALTDKATRKQAYDEIRKLFIASHPQRHPRLLKALRGDVAIYTPPETLTWDELRSMAKNPLVTIGAHTVNHPILSNLSEDDVRTECIQSQQRLETELGVPVLHFAYPFGSKKEADTREYTILRNLKFKTAVTTLAAPVDVQTLDLFAIPRLAIKKRTTADQLDVKLSGWNYLFNGVQI